MKLLLSIILLLFPYGLGATNRIFNRITTENGLSSAQVTDILQDKKGYIWIGTTEGLNRYDGYSFRLFQQDPDNIRSIQSNYIQKLFEDKSGRIWIFLSSGGISYYDPSSDKMVNYSKEWLQQQVRVYGKPLCFSSSISGRILIGTENGLLVFNERTAQLGRLKNTSSNVAFAPVNCLYTAEDNSVWAGTLSGFSLYDQKNDDFIDYPIRNIDDSPAISDNLNGINCIYKDQSGYLWIGTGKKGVFRSLNTNGKLIFQSVGHKNIRVFQFLETRNGDFWIGHNQGATLIRKEKRELLIAEHFFNNPEDMAPTGECQVKSIQEDKQGIVWFSDSRFNQGQFYYSPATKMFGQYRHIPENPYSIGSNQITCLYLDRTGNLWLGHSNDGISLCDLNTSRFNYQFGYTTDNTSLSSNHIVSVYEDSEQNLWVGTTKGLDRINHITSLIDKRFTFSPVSTKNSLSGKMIGSIQEDTERNLWVSYLDANPDQIGLEYFSSHSLSFPYRVENETVLKNTAKVLVDKHGFVWLTTSNSGLIKYDTKIKKTYYYTQPSPYPVDATFSYALLYSLCADNDQHIWIATDGKGLRCMDTIDETFTNFTHKADQPASLASDHIRTLFCDSEGTVWVGTNNGLDKYNKTTQDFEHYTMQNGLAGNVIQGIQEAEPGILFISTNHGITRFNTKNRQMISYSTANGLLSNEFIAGACCKRKSGEIVFGSNKGLVSFQPEFFKEKEKRVYPPLIISDVYFDNEKQNGSSLTLQSEDPYELKIEFLAFDYTHFQSNRYRYKLQTYDSDWKETDSEHRYASYSQLPAGKYLFQVKVSQDGENWSEPVSLSVRILPPWWGTWWFITICVFLGIALLFLFYKNRIRLYKIRQKELEMKIHERTHSLTEAKHSLEEKNNELESVNNKLKLLDEQKTTFFTNISHELRTPLTIINGLTESLEEQSQACKSGEWSESLHTIRRNTGKLIRHVNELLDLSMLDKGILQPHICYSDMSRFLHELADTFRPYADKYGIIFTISISSDIQMAYFDRKIVEEALFNLLSNAFKYTPDKGIIQFTASLRAETTSTWVILRVQDNGIGIPESNIPFIFDRYFQDKSSSFRRFESSGIGLAHTKEIIELHLGTVACQSKNSEGTVFTISIPVSESVYPAEWVVTDNYELIPELPEEYLKNTVEDLKQNKSAIPSDNKPTLLFIEDNEDLCLYLANAFKNDYQVLLAGNGEEGYQKARELLPDAIISDVMMPVMNGIECCKSLKTDERTAHIPIILLTARAAEKQQLEGYDAGADDYMPKPFSLQILRAKINSLILHKKQVQAHFKETFHLNSPDENIPDQDKIFICKATQTVLDNLQNHQFDVEQFCSSMAMSRANLFRKLKTTTGLSASTFTRNIRMKRAEDLLKQHTYTINEIALLVGFADPNYFSRCFKEVYGTTPSNYQETAP